MSETAESREAPKVHRLADAIRQVRNDLADRDDVVIEMREAHRVRLELLAAELTDVIAEVPDDHAGFDFAISAGPNPRFWIDPVAHVGLARDRRTYRFVRDTRVGRVVIAESPDMKIVAQAVTRYVAERIVERQRHLEGAASTASDQQPAAAAEVAGGPQRPLREILMSSALFGVGLMAGGIIVLALLRDRVPELHGLF